MLAALAGLYRELGDWASFLELLPILHKRQVLPKQALEDLERQAHVAQLTAGERDVREIWSRIPNRAAEEPA